MDKYYSSRYVFDPARAIVWKEIVRFLSPYIPRDGVVLDLGAGYCDFINQVKAVRRYAVDSSEELTRYATEEVQAIRTAAWDCVGIADGSVDVVHASNLLEHFDDDELAKTMAEIRRILKPKGKLILLQPNFRLSIKHYFDDPTHKKVFTDAALGHFLESHGFDVVLARPRFLPFSMRSRPSMIPVMPWMIRAYISSPFKPFAGQMLFIAEKI